MKFGTPLNGLISIYPILITPHDSSFGLKKLLLWGHFAWKVTERGQRKWRVIPYKNRVQKPKRLFGIYIPVFVSSPQTGHMIFHWQWDHIGVIFFVNTLKSLNNRGSVPVTLCHGLSRHYHQMTPFLVVNVQVVTASHGQSRLCHALMVSRPREFMWKYWLSCTQNLHFLGLYSGV